MTHQGLFEQRCLGRPSRELVWASRLSRRSLHNQNKSPRTASVPLHREDMQKQEYILTSKNVKCLVSNKHIENLDLQCYCNWGNSLNYRLDKETAVARISELKQSDEGRCVASVEHIDKISKPDLEAVRLAMTVEWKTALTHAGSESGDSSYMSPQRAEFYENPPRKVRRVHSEPQSPQRTGGA